MPLSEKTVLKDREAVPGFDIIAPGLALSLPGIGLEIYSHAHRDAQKEKGGGEYGFLYHKYSSKMELYQYNSSPSPTNLSSKSSLTVIH